MKKLIVSGFALATIFGAAPQITNLSKVNTSNLQTKKINNNQENSLLDFAYIAKYFNSKTEKEKQILKANVLNAISLKNGAIIVNSNKLNKKQWDSKIYQLITAKEYIHVLINYYQNKLLIFDKNNKVYFNFKLLKKIKINGIWVETYWYWFGYWILHFSSSTIETITEGGTSLTEITQQIIEAFPPAAPIALVIAGWVTIHIAILKSYDSGRGSWVMYYLVVPIPLHFGSN